MNHLDVLIDDKFESHFEYLRQVFLCVTDSCDLKCRHCLYKPWLSKGRDIQINNAISLITRFHEMGAIKLSLLGGEPTQYGLIQKENSLPLLIETAKQIGYKYIRLVTNGVFRVELWNDSRLKNLDEISFSFDSFLPEIHDKLRGSGSFNIALANLTNAIDNGYVVDMTTCVHRSNFMNFKNDESSIHVQIRWATSLGVNRINFHPIFKMGVDRDKWTGESDISPSEWVSFYDSIRKEIDDNKFSIEVRIPQRFVSSNQFNDNAKYYGYCPVKMGERIEVHPNGLIQICALLKGTDISVARYNISSDKINISWETKRNEIKTFPFSFDHDHPCAIMQRNFGDFVPLCISFKPKQNELIWKNLCIDNYG